MWDSGGVSWTWLISFDPSVMLGRSGRSYIPKQVKNVYAEEQKTNSIVSTDILLKRLSKKKRATKVDKRVGHDRKRILTWDKTHSSHFTLGTICFTSSVSTSGGPSSVSPTMAAAFCSSWKKKVLINKDKNNNLLQVKQSRLLLISTASEPLII